MKWIKALKRDLVEPKNRQVVDIEGHRILLIENAGRIYAVLNSCPHMGVPMKRGKITGENDIVCPFHHSVFDLETGDVKEWAPWPPVVGPLMGKVKPEQPLPVYPTKVENGFIWIGIGDSS